MWWEVIMVVRLCYHSVIISIIHTSFQLIAHSGNFKSNNICVVGKTHVTFLNTEKNCKRRWKTGVLKFQWHFPNHGSKETFFDFNLTQIMRIYPFSNWLLFFAILFYYRSYNFIKTQNWLEWTTHGAHFVHVLVFRI